MLKSASSKASRFINVMLYGVNIGRRPLFSVNSIALSNPLIHRGILLVEIMLATTLVLFLLGEKSFWFDEAYSYDTAGNWMKIWHIMLRNEPNMWLYYTLLHYWLRFGNSEFMIRSLTAFFAIATVPVTYVLAKRLFGMSVGILSTLLLISNTFFIEYAQEARSYSLLLFLTVLSSYLLLKSVGQPSWPYWVGYIVCIVLATLTHFFGALVFVAHVMSLIYMRWKTGRKLFIISGVTLAILIIPFLILQPKGVGAVTWISPPTIKIFLKLFYVLAGYSPGSLLVYSVLILVALGVGILNFSQIKLSLENWPYVFLMSWLVAPVIISLFYSFLITPVFILRYLIICLPPFVILAAAGLSKLDNKRSFIIVLIILLMLSGQSLFRWYFIREKENWKDATLYVYSQAQPDDAVLFFAYFVRIPFEYYMNQINLSNDPPNLLQVSSEPNPRIGGQLPEPNLELLGRLSSDYPRVWLILSHEGEPRLKRDIQSQSIQTALAREYKMVREEKFKQIRVLLYERIDSFGRTTTAIRLAR